MWVRYTWDLVGTLAAPPLPAGYESRRASLNEGDDVLAVVLAAYASDTHWAPKLGDIERRMAERVRTTLGAEGTPYLAVAQEGGIVAVSGIATTHWTDQNLLTGICVHPGHQGRGLGRFLLGWSLEILLDMGLSEAKVYTEAGCRADRGIYRLFGARREEGVEYPGLHSQGQGTSRA